jgi:predicted ABC-type sugar transport system permease subunit
MSTSPTEQASGVTGRVDGKGAPPGLGGLALPSRVKLQEYALVGVVLALVVIGAILKPDSFPTADNLRAILTQASVVGVLAVGMTFVIATAGIDLSVGSVVAASGIAGGLVVDSGAAAFVAAAVGFGLGLGLVNGSAIAYGKVVPFRGHPGDVRHGTGPGVADERQEPDQPPGLGGRSLVRDR